MSEKANHTAATIAWAHKGRRNWWTTAAKRRARGVPEDGPSCDVPFPVSSSPSGFAWKINALDLAGSELLLIA
jgi:hypothetical protein